MDVKVTMDASRLLDFDYLGLNKFEIYHNNNKGLHSNYNYSWSLPFEKLPDHVAITHLFQRYWYLTILLSVIYYTNIRIVQAWMRKRKPFELSRELFYWNLGLAIFSFVALIRVSEDFFYTWRSFGFTYTLCRTCNPAGVAGFWSLAFGLSKVVELGDTLFIVLRKRPLIFLHYYHHAAVMIYGSHTAAEHAAPGQAFCIMNLFAHSVMYSYYAYTSLGKRTARWVSMIVTTIQTTQMLCGVAITFYVFYLKLMYPQIPCQQSFANIWLAFILYITFAILFVQFFVNAYITNTHHQRKLREMAEAEKKVE
ncbi:Elongation of very long chain fatty acids protein [Aphelenchoides besseyi]|nr:Elongation of very long chain fatty acids protein [Aphelenchoides besseyi]KAI6193227.1 Elongation of very long chain fatty acids protein [Aphelenchoides besseyi]